MGWSLETERFAAESKLWPRGVRWLMSLGYRPESLLYSAPGIGVSRVEVSGGLFQPDDEGKPAIIAPVWIVPPVTLEAGGRTGGVLLDLAAVDLHTGGIALRRGAACCLGEHLLGEPGGERETRLRCFLDGRDWLKVGGDGVCPVDWCGFTARVSGEPRVKLFVDSLGDGEALDAGMRATLRVLPEILVRTNARRAAA